MTPYKKREVILVPFPFTNLSSTKHRPALIISPDSYNQNKDLVIAYITSQLNTSARLGDYKLQKWREASLPKPSMVRMKFATIEKSIVIKKIGELESMDYEKIEKNIVNFFKS